MDRVVRFSPDERSGLFTQTAANMGITPALVEKDFWVVYRKVYSTDNFTAINQYATYKNRLPPATAPPRGRNDGLQAGSWSDPRNALI